MRDIRKLTEEEIAKVKLMAHDHPFYEVAMAMYDCTLLGEVPLLGYTAQNFFLDVISEAEDFFLETGTGKEPPIGYFEESWDSLCDELNEFDESEDTKITLQGLEDYYQQVLKVSAVVHAAESILFDYADKTYHREGNKNLTDFLLGKYPDTARLKNRMKTVITTQQDQLLKDYISEMTSEEIPFYADDYYDELRPDYPTGDKDAMPSWWYIAEGKKELFANHVAQMLEEGVFGRRFNLPINSREDFISDIETFFNLEKGELQKLID